MIIEALVRWTEVKFEDTDPQEEYISRLKNGEEEMKAPKISYDYSPMCFDINDVVRWNKTNSDEFTTLRFADGESFVVKIPYDYFMKLYMEHTGKAVKKVQVVKEDSNKKDELLDGI